MLIISIIIVASHIVTTEQVLELENKHTGLQQRIIALQQPLQIQQQKEIAVLQDYIEQRIEEDKKSLEEYMQFTKREIDKANIPDKHSLANVITLEKMITEVKQQIITLTNTSQFTKVQIENIIQKLLDIVNTSQQNIFEILKELRNTHNMQQIFLMERVHNMVLPGMKKVLQYTMDRLLSLMERKAQKEQVLQKAENELKEIIQQLPQINECQQTTDKIIQQKQEIKDINEQLLKAQQQQQQTDSTKKINDASSFKNNIDKLFIGGTAGLIIGAAGIIFSTTSIPSKNQTEDQEKAPNRRIQRRRTTTISKTTISTVI